MQTTLPKEQSRLPAYLVIAQTLRERIEEGAYSTEEFLPPERDLAVGLRVSRQTIRQAIEVLRQEGKIVPEQGRGNRVVASIRYPSSTPSASQFNLTALIIYGISLESSAAICQGAAAVMREADYHLIVAETMFAQNRRAADEAAHLRGLIDKGIRGIILYAEPTAHNRLLLQEALRRGIHVVQIDRYMAGVSCDYVGVDNTTAAREMTEHLLKTGHRHIAFFSHHPEPSSCRERIEGYRQALYAFDPTGNPDALTGYLESNKKTESEVERQLDHWFSMSERPDAIFAVNDELAVLVVQVLQRRGLKVPDDVAVVGFDNLRATALISPPLTTVQQPFVDMGAAAAHRLLDRLSGRYTGKPQRVLLPTDLVIRQSCGAKAKSGKTSEGKTVGVGH